MKQNEKGWNTTYNNVNYGEERTQQNATIAIHPWVDTYEESTTEDITNLYTTTKLYELLYEEFQKSPFYEKYGKPILKKKYKDVSTNPLYGEDTDTTTEETEDSNIEEPYGINDDYINPVKSDMEKYIFKKVDKSDMANLYYYFEDKIAKKAEFSELDAFIGIAEFFGINYSVLYNDIISIESKSQILSILKENHKLGKMFGQVNRLY